MMLLVMPISMGCQTEAVYGRKNITLHWINPAYKGALPARSDIFLLLSFTCSTSIFLQNSRFHPHLIVACSMGSVVFNDMCFFCVCVCDFPVIKSLFSSVLVMYTHVKVDKAVQKPVATCGPWNLCLQLVSFSKYMQLMPHSQIEWQIFQWFVELCAHS